MASAPILKGDKYSTKKAGIIDIDINIEDSEKAGIIEIDINIGDSETVDLIDDDSDDSETVDLIDRDSDDSETVDLIDRDSDDSETVDLIDRDSDDSETVDVIDRARDDSETVDVIDRARDDSETVDVIDRARDDSETVDVIDRARDDSETVDVIDRARDDSETVDVIDRARDDSETVDVIDRARNDSETVDLIDRARNDSETVDLIDRARNDSETVHIIDPEPGEENEATRTLIPVEIVNPVPTAGGVNNLPYYIDALLYTSQARWNKNSPLGTPVEVTFSFMQAKPESNTWDEFKPFTAQQQESARQGLKLYSDISNITFKEASNANGGGKIQFGSIDLPIGYAGWSTGVGSATKNSRIWLDKNIADITPGSSGFTTLLHEIGHSIGLKHPHEGVVNMPNYQDNDRFTLMSYNSHPDMPGVTPETPQLFDVAAVQYLYGANTDTRSGNNTYSWGKDAKFIETIWDGGGTDQISAANQTKDVVIRPLAK